MKRAVAAISEGLINWEHGFTWYRVVGELGDGALAPLVILHGGPGCAHDYVESIAELAAQVSALEQRVAALEADLTSLREQLADLLG